MKIQQLTLKHFRRFGDFTLDFDPKLTVLVAANGAGKTSILDGVATCLGAFLTRIPGVKGLSLKEADFQIDADGHRPPYMRVSCKASNGVAWDLSESRDKTQKTASQIPPALGRKQLHQYIDPLIDAFNDDQPFELPIFIYYGTGRGVFDIPKRTKGFGKSFNRFDAFDSSLASRTNFRRFVEFFYYLEEREHQLQKAQRSFDISLPELNAIRTAITRLIPDFSNPRGAYPAGIMVDWRRGSNKNKAESVKQLRIEQLSDGYRTTLAMVMDIASRMAEANPEMADPLNTEGVVLIDEVDLHLHPGWQQHILDDLQRTFPNLQFIVSTHSPQVVSSVKPESLRVIDWQEEIPYLRPVDFSEGAEAQQMLLEVLGAPSARAEQTQPAQMLRRYQQLVETDQWETEEAQELRIRLDRWGREHEPELARLDMDIRLKELDRQDAKNQ